jgi:hypothetical protein
LKQSQFIASADPQQFQAYINSLTNQSGQQLKQANELKNAPLASEIDCLLDYEGDEEKM